MDECKYVFVHIYVATNCFISCLCLFTLAGFLKRLKLNCDYRGSKPNCRYDSLAMAFSRTVMPTVRENHCDGRGSTVSLFDRHSRCL